MTAPLTTGAGRPPVVVRNEAGRSPVFLLPVDRPALVRQAYAWGARNCELHFHQVLGDWTPFAGVNMPTFMPETG